MLAWMLVSRMAYNHGRREVLIEEMQRVFLLMYEDHNNLTIHGKDFDVLKAKFDKIGVLF